MSGDLARLGSELNHLLARFQAQQADQAELLEKLNALQHSSDQQLVEDGVKFSGSPVSQLAHEFNNVIQVVMGFSELALRHLESGHEARPLIEEVLKTSSHASAFTRRFLRQGESAED